MSEVLRNKDALGPVEKGPKTPLLMRLFRSLFQEILLATYLSSVKMSDLPEEKRAPITKTLEPEIKLGDLFPKDKPLISLNRGSNDPYNEPFKIQDHRPRNTKIYMQKGDNGPHEIEAFDIFLTRNPELVLNNPEIVEGLPNSEEILKAAQDVLEGRSK